MNESEIKLPYDVPVEVSEKAFNIIMNKPYSGTCAGKKGNDGKYYIKLWIMGYSKTFKKIIAENPIIE